MTRQNSLSVFVPALNEEKNLRPTVEKVLEALRQICNEFEVLIVNDGSYDNSGRIAEELATKFLEVRVIHHPTTRGLGAGYASAMGAATKKYFVFIPGDNSWPFESILTLLRHIGEADVVTSYPTNAKEQRTASRQLLSLMYTQLLNMLHGKNFHYYNGLTIYPTEFLVANPVRSSGFGFAAELLLHAAYKGTTIIEVGLPIQERLGSGSKALTIRNVASVLKSVIRGFWNLRMRRRFRS
jgi:dolichol-phosphate mannosyltransferase